MAGAAAIRAHHRFFVLGFPGDRNKMSFRLEIRRRTRLMAYRIDVP